jgi:hypothetical protein
MFEAISRLGDPPHEPADPRGIERAVAQKHLLFNGEIAPAFVGLIENADLLWDAASDALGFLKDFLGVESPHRADASD